MPDGPIVNETTIDSTSPSREFFRFQPTNIRDMLQRQIRTTVDRSLDSYAQMSMGKWDGRYLNGMPGEVVQGGDNDGNYYHIVGMSIVGDVTVASP